jgi:ATP-dependent helicase/nuclease subunit A
VTRNDAQRAPTLIGASAGSGKTYRLTEVVTSAVDPTRAEPVSLEGLVAVTYTQKGAAELASRIRQSFGRAGAHAMTPRLPLAYIGTVHAVCLRLVKEFAIDAGLSPLVDVMPGAEARMLRQALEWGLEPEFRARIDSLAQSFELRWDPKTKRIDWLTPVQDIMTLARSNRVAPGLLPAMAERSASRLLELLGPAEPDGEALEAELRRALEAASDALAHIDDGVKATNEVREKVEEALKSARKGRLKWSDWVRLQRLKPGKAALAAVAPLQAVAARVDGHPEFQASLRELTYAVYEAARRGLTFYDEWKKRRRIIDFVDMLDRALTLVEHPDVRAELSRRFELLVVDEFQDTSPIQLALFVRLHELAGRSTWVGDRKQCIFEYAGADPELMEAAAEWARQAGGTIEHLPHNWRSRPELVESCNALFSAALGPHGYDPAEVATSPKRPALEALGALPPLGFWALETKNRDEDAMALARGVRRLLDSPSQTPVYDRTTDRVRDVRPGDVAVLVATNAEAENLANALAKLGVRAAIARAGLLATPEGVLTVAALRRLVEPNNALAAAEIEALTGFSGLSPDAWLDAKLSLENERLAARAAETDFTPPEPEGHVARLVPLAAEVHALSPTEALDRVLAILDVASLCRRWPDPVQRLANLDALRGLAAQYEARCEQQREAATVAGLLRFFDEAAERVLVRDEELASDDQHTSTGSDAVTILTYHRSKGLEWPVVVLGSLDRKARRHAFEVSPETDAAAFDPANPLSLRWIRYWPWPFGGLDTCRLGERAAASKEGLAIAEREARERVRLLYVGFTRARDHLVITARRTKSGYATPWLDELCSADGTPLLRLPGVERLATEDAPLELVLGDETRHIPARTWLLGPAATAAHPDEPESRLWFAPGTPPSTPRPSYWISPSHAGGSWQPENSLFPVEQATIGARLPLGHGTADWDVVGNAVHAFLAADLPTLTREQRLERAARLLAASQLLDVLAPESLLAAGDHLRAWIESRWPGAIWHREVPIHAAFTSEHGARHIAGTVDLLLELPEGVILIDHKSYPGRQESWHKKAAEYAPQLAAYSEALKLSGKAVLEHWIHFTLGGGAVRLAAET